MVIVLILNCYTELVKEKTMSARFIEAEAIYNFAPTGIP